MSDQKKPSFAFQSSSSVVRLDRELSQVVEGLNRRRARELCERRAVLVNGRAQAPGYILKLNDRVECYEPIDFERLDQIQHSQPLCIIFEDTWLLVVEKPRAMHSVIQRSDDSPTLADAIVAYHPQSKDCSKDNREAGLVQRLDYFTSGLLIAAKSKDIWDKLHQMFVSEKIEKSYLALVEGYFPQREVCIDRPIFMPRNSNKVEVLSPADSAEQEGSLAMTTVKSCSSVNSECSLVQAFVHRGRRHQVRAHLADAGYALVGDATYGAKTSLESCLDCKNLALDAADGFLLHAETLAFKHPITGQALELRSQNPTIETLKIMDYLGER